MKKIVSLLLVFMFLFNFSIVYAKSTSSEIQPLSKFTYEYEYSPLHYEFKSTSIVTNSDIVKAVGAGTFTAGIALQLLGIPHAGKFGIVASGIVLLYDIYGWDKKDYRVDFYSRYKKQYKVNKLTGQRILMNRWRETMSYTYTRDAGTTGDWTFEETNHSSLHIKK